MKRYTLEFRLYEHKDKPGWIAWCTLYDNTKIHSLGQGRIHEESKECQTFEEVIEFTRVNGTGHNGEVRTV